MIPGKDARRTNFLDAELDALVAREVDALALRQVRASPKPRAPHEDATMPASVACEPEGDALEFPAHRSRHATGQAARSRSSADNVIGMRHGSLPGVLVFSTEEEAFIEQAVAFLRERANADVIIEEVWMHTVVDRDDDADRSADNEGLVADEALAADDVTKIENSIVPTDVGTSATNDDRVMPLQPSATTTRARSGSRSAETAPAESPPSLPATQRGRQKPEASEQGRDGDG